jgi:MYND finger
MNAMSPYERALEALDQYSSNHLNRNEMLDFLGYGFKKAISSLTIAQNIFADIYGRIAQDDFLEGSDVLNLVFLGSGRASLELFIVLRYLLVKQEFERVNYKRVRIILCDLLYKNDKEEGIMDNLQRIVKPAQNISLEFADAFETLPERIGRQATRKNTLFFAFNFNVVQQSVSPFLDSLNDFTNMTNCWLYIATSIPDEKRGESHNGRKRVFRDVTTLKSGFKAYSDRPTHAREFVESNCSWCGLAVTGLQHCGGCFREDILYCGTDCQASHWMESHKHECLTKK